MTKNDKLTAWAEGEVSPRPGSIERGEKAAASGRQLLEDALGGPDALHRAITGRPSLDATAAPGAHSKTHSFRLPESLSVKLKDQATAESRRASEIVRDALDEYLTSHRTG